MSTHSRRAFLAHSATAAGMVALGAERLLAADKPADGDYQRGRAEAFEGAVELIKREIGCDP